MADVAALKIIIGVFGFFEKRGDRQCIGREIEAREVLHLVLDQKFLSERLGLGRVRRFLVAVDELDIVPRDLGAMLRHPGFNAGLEILAEQCERPGHGADNAHLDDIRTGRARHQASDRQHTYEFRCPVHF